LEGTLENVSLSYLENGIDETITIDADVLFSNNANICPMTSCSLHKANDCDGNSFSAPDEVTLSGSYPWVISASRSKLPGYDHSLCLKCSNGVES
jgi:hypothetical protein